MSMDCQSKIMLPSTTATMKFLATLVMVVTKVVATRQWALKGCPQKCGNVTISYPFGIGKGCYYDTHMVDGTNYEVKCTHHMHGTSPRPTIGNMELIRIDVIKAELRVVNYASHACYFKNGTQIKSKSNNITLDMGKFTMSTTKNVFAVTGCDTYVWFEGMRQNVPYKTGCMTICDNMKSITNGTCSGLGCCQISIPTDITNITIETRSFDNHTNVNNFNPCGSAFILAKDKFNFSTTYLARVPNKTNEIKFPVILDWMIGTKNCSTAKASGNILCKGNSTCVDSKLDAGYQCKCLPGYRGNPYLENGCTDFNECSDEKHNQCEKPKYCVNTIGGYYCRCPYGFQGNGTKDSGCIKAAKICGSKPFQIVVGVGGAIVASIVLGTWLFWQHEKKQLIKARKKFFQQNGGCLLHQKLYGRDVAVERVKLFEVEELEKATNKYSDNNIIGKGGFGVVYKGNLANNQVIAIKKSLEVDPDQREQFINEVIVLSQLNNRHVVKLLGCCLETEVPLLVYEFIDNGTLHDHLHDETKASRLTWELRLRIALEVAEVLTYLHTTISIPIIHRDMKSMNILLDKNYTAKVSDFGTSRLVPTDQHHLATMVLGTCGYLDPEYLQTGELTHKSDVYSFGVALVELITRQKAVSNTRCDSEKCLAIYFLRKLRDERLRDILDSKMLTRDELMKQIEEVANLAERCLKVKGEERPSMKEVATELERIKGLTIESNSWCRSVMMVPDMEERCAQYVDDIVLVENDENCRPSFNNRIDNFSASSEFER